MEQVHVDWQKEQERIEREKLERERLEKEQEKLKESENTDLSAPNKLQDSGKNLTSKQKAALVRQQRLAKAKSVTNKAHKKTSEGKSSKSGKNAPKDGNEATAKDKNKSKPKTKQSKVKPPTNVDSSEGQSASLDSIVDVVSISAKDAGEVAAVVTTTAPTGMFSDINLKIFSQRLQTRKYCFLAVFPEGGQTRKHCFPAMFPEGGQTRKIVS